MEVTRVGLGWVKLDSEDVDEWCSRSLLNILSSASPHRIKVLIGTLYMI